MMTDEELREYNHQRYIKHGEKIRAKIAAYKETNRDAINARRRTAYAKKKGNSLPPSEMAEATKGT